MSVMMYALGPERLLVLGDETRAWGAPIARMLDSLLMRIPWTTPTMVILAEGDPGKIDEVTNWVSELALPLLLLTLEGATGHGRLLVHDARFPELACPRCVVPCTPASEHCSTDTAILFSQILLHVIEGMRRVGPPFVQRHNLWIGDAARVRVSETLLMRLDGCTHSAPAKAA